MSVTLTPLPAARFDGWRAATRERMITGQQDTGLRPGADAVTRVDAMLAELVPHGAASTASGIFAIREGEHDLGVVWTTVKDAKLFVLDLQLTTPLREPDADGGVRDALLDAICALATSRGAAKVAMSVHAHDAEGRAFVADRGFEVVSIQMLLEPVPDHRPEGPLEVTPMTAERFPRFAARSTAVFADELVASGRYDRAQAVAESRRQMALELPDGLATEGQELLTASVDGAEVGVLWVGHRLRDGRPHVFVLDIEVDEAQRGKGYGRALMHTVEGVAHRIGADSVGLHVFAANATALSLYEDLGYRRAEEVFLLHLSRRTGDHAAR